MKKVKYFYNTHTLRFEKFVTPVRIRILRTLGFIIASLIAGFVMLVLVFNYVDNPKEKLLRSENMDLKENYDMLQRRTRDLEMKMNELENRDNNIYRTIFEANPIPDSARLKDAQVRNEVEMVKTLDENELVVSLASQLNDLSMRIAFQKKSFLMVESMVKNRQHLLRSIPAIQPVSKKDLSYLASGFGVRIDPVYKIAKFHAGLDFAAPTGTPIYATADGEVIKADFNNGGYGNHVVINHGYGYQTIYGHMSKIKTQVGRRVKRGEIIGYVGSTGKSTGSHCHYEIHKNGVPVDPVYYFYSDLTPAQFERIVKLAATANQSLD